MHYPPEAAQNVLSMVEDVLRRPDAPDMKLKILWWTLLSARAHALTGSLAAVAGTTILGGPFKGMKLTPAALEAYRTTVMLGTYEHELHDVFEKVIAEKYDVILNIGCSIGYYAIGLALRLPHTKIKAFDIDPEARRKCAEMAQLNGVADRLTIDGEFKGADYAAYANKKTLVLMDIEGSERELLNPEAFPALQKMDVIVELHDMLSPGLSQLVTARFPKTHDISLITNRPVLPDLEKLVPSLGTVDGFDQLIMTWEARDGATPWGIYKAR